MFDTEPGLIAPTAYAAKIERTEEARRCAAILASQTRDACITLAYAMDNLSQDGELNTDDVFNVLRFSVRLLKDNSSSLDEVVRLLS